MPGSAEAVGATTAELANASAVTNAANIFRTGAERILCGDWNQPRNGLGSVADQQLLMTPPYREATLICRSWAKPQSNSPMA